MQDILQAPAQPFVKLIQANMDLLTRFTTSPEVTAQASANASSLFQQTSETASRLMQSGAFVQLMQGMFKNYSEFMMELGQSSLALMTQGQAVLARQAQEVTENVVDATETRGRRARGTSLSSNALFSLAATARFPRPPQAT